MVRRWLVNLLLVFVVAAILFVTAGIIISRNYGDEVKSYAIQQLNQQLKVKVSVEQIDLSFLSRFPYLSIVLNNVTAWSGEGFDRSEFQEQDTDTLFNADKIYLQFNIFDILTGNYRLRRVHAAGGNLNLLVDSRGKVNYMLFKEGKKEGKSRDIELQGVKLENFKLSFINRAKDMNISAYVGDVMFKGKFSEGNYDMATLASFRLIDVTRQGVQYAGNSEVSTRIILNINGEHATVEKGEVKYNNLGMSISGTFGLGKVSEVDLTLTGRDFDLRSLFLSLPRYQQEKLPFDVYGRGNIAVKVKGDLSRIDVPAVRAAYNLNINKLNYNDRHFQNIRLKGSYSNGNLRNPASTQINIEDYHINDYRSQLSGFFRLVNLKEPSFNLKVRGFFDASVINEFFPSADVHDFSGRIEPDMNVKAKLGSFENFNLQKILSSGLSGSLSLKDLSFVTADNFRVKAVNGITRFTGDTWFPELNVTAGNSIFSASLRLDNILTYLSGREGSLWITGSAGAQVLDLTPFLPDQDGKKNDKALNFPDKLFMKVDLDVENLNAGKFSATNIKTFLQYKPGFLSFSPFTMLTAEGNLDGGGAVIQDEKKNIYIRTQADFRQLDIHKLFYSFNNFDQDFITDKNLKGKLTGTADVSMTFDSLMNIKEDELAVNTDIIIRSGELIDFEPVKNLSRFIAVEELEHIYFSTLENKIVIRDGQIGIPRMEINSSAFNIIVSGVHHFNNDFDYKLKVNLSEILSGKARNARKENREFGVVEADNRRTSLYLSIEGNPDDFDIRYDRKEAMHQVKQDIKEEKTNLKAILNEEFGWFKKDSAEIQSGNEENKKFIIDWGTDDASKEQSHRKKKKMNPEKKSQEEEKVKFEWEDI